MELTDSTFTVLITADGASGTAVRELCDQWHAGGLLRDFAIVTPSSVQARGVGPSTIMASICGTGETVELMRHLGSRRRTLIRLVVLHLLTHADSSAESLIRVCDDVGTQIKRAMPTATRSGTAGVRLLRVNLLVPETDITPQNATMLQPGWEVNAIVSPEDRPDLDRLNVFVRADLNLYGHGLAAAATVGGLWRGMRVAAFDEREQDSTTGASDLVVVRSQVKLIAGDQRASRLAHAAVQSVVGNRNGAVRHLNWGVPADRPDQLVEGTFERLIREADWTPQDRVYQPLIKKQVSLGTVIGDWARFQASLPFAAMGFFRERAVEALERNVTNTFVGEEAGVIGRVRPVTPDQASELATRRINQLTAALDPDRLLQEDAATWGQSTPAAWRMLREVVIGLVDGSPLPTGFSRAHRDRLLEVLPPSYVVPAPDEGPWYGQRLRGVDIEGAANLAQRPDINEPAPQRPQMTAPPAEPAGDSPTAEVEAPDGAAATESAAKTEAGQPTADAADAAPTEVAAEVAPAKKGRRGRARNREPKAPVTTSSGPSRLECLERWVADRSDSLLWKLASHAYVARRSEADRAHAAAEAIAVNRTAPAADELAKARRRLVLSWRATLAGLVVGALLIWGSTRYAIIREFWVNDWRHLGIGSAVLIAIFVLGGHQYYLALRRYEWQVKQRLFGLRAACDEYATASQQAKRWALMYSGVLDWSDVFAEFMHRPWVEKPLPAPPDEQPIPGLPAAVALAMPAGQAVDLSPALIAGAVEAVCERGWIKEQFSNVLALSPLNETGADGSGDLPADLDLGLRINGARAELVALAQDPSTHELATVRVYEEIDSLAADDQIRTPELEVHRVGDYATDEVLDYREFLASICQEATPFTGDVFGDSALVAQRHVPAMTVLGLPRGVKATAGNQVVAYPSSASLATRLDVSGTVQPPDIKLFHGPERAAMPAVGDPSAFN